MPGMKLNRRKFLILTATFAAGCSSPDSADVMAMHRELVVDAGPAGNYTSDGVYAAFRNEGFFMIRQGDRLFALSAICTHRRCKLEVERDRSFYCPCHGSTFDPNGRVTHGPARRDLTELAVSANDAGHLIVTVPGA